MIKTDNYFQNRPSIFGIFNSIWHYDFGSLVKGHFGALVLALGPRPIFVKSSQKWLLLMSMPNSCYFYSRFALQSWSSTFPRNLWYRPHPSSNSDWSQDTDHQQVDDHHASGHARPISVHLQQHHVCNGQLGRHRGHATLHGQASRPEVLWEGPIIFLPKCCFYGRIWITGPDSSEQRTFTRLVFRIMAHFVWY